MSEEEEVLKQTVIEEEKPKDSLADRLRARKAAQKKKRIIIISLGCVLSVFSGIAWWLFKPRTVNPEYGICRSFLELNIPYPHTLYVSQIKRLRDRSLRLWYTHIDAFGEFRMESFQCKMARNPNTKAMELIEIKMDKVYLEPDKIASLNNALPYFEENPLILNWPAPLPDSLEDLLFDFDSVRSVILNIRKR